MKRTILRYAGGFAVTLAAAVLLQALYAVHPDPLTGTLAPINESPWELSKALFWPYLCGALLIWALGRDGDQRGGHCTVLLLMPLLCVIAFSLLKEVNPWLIWGIVLGIGISLYALVFSRKLWGGELLWYTLAILLGIAYILFTVLPPTWHIFLDPRDVATFVPIPF